MVGEGPGKMHDHTVRQAQSVISLSEYRFVVHAAIGDLARRADTKMPLSLGNGCRPGIARPDTQSVVANRNGSLAPCSQHGSFVSV